MRNTLTLAMAPYVGKVLTPEVARAILALVPAEGAPLDLAQFPPKTCGRLTFAAERALHILPELDVLHRAHWNETEGYHRGIPMDPDLAAGLADEQAGKLLQLTARDPEGVLVGNIRMYVGMRSRHTRRQMAQEDTVYLLPEWRGGLYALRFLQFMESCLRILGVEEVYLDDKVANQSAGRLAAFMGYEHVANRRYKILEESHVRERSRHK